MSNQIYEFQVAGQYYATGLHGAKVINNYNVSLKLPTTHAALSIIKNKLITKILQKTFKDYVNYRTVYIIDYKMLSGQETRPFNQIPLDEMNRDMLHKYLADNNLNVDISTITSLAGCVRRIKDALEKPKESAEKEAQRQKEAAFDAELDALNKDDAGTSDAAPAPVSTSNNIENADSGNSEATPTPSDDFDG